MTPPPAVLLLTPLLPEGEKLLDSAVRVGVAVVVGFLIQRLLFLLVGRVEVWVERAGKGGEYARQRAHTLGQMLRNLATVLVAGGVVIHSLAAFGWNVVPLLAGAGILGAALGFGAQSVVRDSIAGVFILAEDQFGVGDVIEIDGKPATVEALRVRSTTLRDFNGYLYFVPNGEMRVVVNRSRGWTRHAVDVPLPVDEDVDRALETCRQVAREMGEDPAWRPRLQGPVEVWGVETLGPRELHIRTVVRAAPGPDAADAVRELRLRIVRGFAAAGLRLDPVREIRIQPAPGEPPGARPGHG